MFSLKLLKLSQCSDPVYSILSQSKGKKGKLSPYFVIQTLLAARTMSNKYLGDENYNKVQKSNKVSITIFCFQGIQNLIHNKDPL